MKVNWDAVLTTALVVSALLTTGLVVRNEFFPKQRGIDSTQKLLFIENWRVQFANARRLGSQDAPVQLIEFYDYECPYCASFHATLEKIRKQYQQKIAVSLIHYPLAGHPFAEPAARAAECAGEQGYFETMHTRLFNQQRAFGLRSWRDLADDAGVSDLSLFASCVESDRSVDRIIEGKRIGEQLSVRGTPTIIVNGWLLGKPPTAEELDSMVRQVLAGENPSFN